MLPADLRMRRGSSFTYTFKNGVRCGGKYAVIHLADGQADGSLVGFVVSKKIGNAVVRNRVKRRLREIIRANQNALPENINLVVRAKPAAVGAVYGSFEADVIAAIGRAQARRT